MGAKAVFLDSVLSQNVTVGVQPPDVAKRKPLPRWRHTDAISDARAETGNPQDVGKEISGFKTHLYHHSVAHI